jgi:hypothetical protein
MKQKKKKRKEKQSRRDLPASSVACGRSLFVPSLDIPARGIVADAFD